MKTAIKDMTDSLEPYHLIIAYELINHFYHHPRVLPQGYPEKR